MPTAWAVAVVCLFVLFAAMTLALLALIRQVGILSIEARRNQLHTTPPVGLEIGTVAPVLEGQTPVSRQRISTQELRGAMLLLVFLSHECGPCRAIVPHLNGLLSDAAIGFRTLAVIGADDEIARAFIDETGLQVPVLAGRRHFEAFRVTATPQCIIVDGEGVVVRAGSAQTREEFVSLVTGPPPTPLTIVEEHEPALAS